MGILVRRLEKGVNYWVAELPSNETPFLYPELRELTEISFDQQEVLAGNNYECTYEFGDIHILSYMEPEMKCYMVYIGRFIVTKESAKMQMVIRNNVNPDLHEGKILDKNLDILAIKTYISQVDENHPELLI